MNASLITRLAKLEKFQEASGETSSPGFQRILNECGVEHLTRWDAAQLIGTVLNRTIGTTRLIPEMING
jgi:hypothetical protein